MSEDHPNRILDPGVLGPLFRHPIALGCSGYPNGAGVGPTEDLGFGRTPIVP